MAELVQVGALTTSAACCGCGGEFAPNKMPSGASPTVWCGTFALTQFWHETQLKKDVGAFFAVAATTTGFYDIRGHSWPTNTFASVCIAGAIVAIVVLLLSILVSGATFDASYMNVIPTPTAHNLISLTFKVLGLIVFAIRAPHSLAEKCS